MMEQKLTDTPQHQTLALKTRDDQLSSFFPLLQRGVTLRADVGCSLRELLCDQLGIPADYVTGRITTIFLDNHPLDDLDSTVSEGARITLSAAMPGLVGAVMRRGGFYASLREGITHAETAKERQAGTGTVTLKLFNLLLPELGPLVLARGILLDKKELNLLLGRLSALWMASYPSGFDGDGVHLTVTFTD
jgi:hypothetical protein